MYRIELAKSSVKALESFDGKTQKRVYRALEALKVDPSRGTNIKKLRGELRGRFRYRAGDIRIIYKVVTEGKTVFVEAIGMRGGVYK
jgi:mRNA-degrading endonuclease RelE of RelBE toxin-antitoxin system